MDGSGQADGDLTPPSDGVPIVVEPTVIEWADPARAMLDLTRWRGLAGAGAPIGGDPYSAYCAEDGSLPLWPLAAVLAEAKLARAFVVEELGGAYAGLRVPGPETTCADGDFLPALMAIEPEVRLGLPKLTSE